MSTFTIFGASYDAELYFSHHVAKRIADKSPGTYIEFNVMLEIDYLNRMKALRVEKKGNFYSFRSNYCVMRDGLLLGTLDDLVEVAIKEFGIVDAEIANEAMFGRMSNEETVKAVRAAGHPVVYLEIYKEETDPGMMGTLIIELFDDLCPETCQNFKLLCTGERIRERKTEVDLSYRNCPIHRVVKGGWIQSGDIMDGSGTHSISASGEYFADECYSVDFGCELGGIVGCANKGPHTNGSQFFITLGPCQWMNNKKVGFGRVLQGYSVLKEIEESVLVNERPQPSIFINSSGMY